MLLTGHSCDSVMVINLAAFYVACFGHLVGAPPLTLLLIYPKVRMGEVHLVHTPYGRDF